MLVRTTAAGFLTLVVALAASSGAWAATTVTVSLWDKPDGAMGITASAPQAAVGPVTFTVTNSSSQMVHEMIVVRLTAEQAAHPEALPYDTMGGMVDEDKVDDVGEVSELDPGKSGSLTVDLAAGTYELICNVPGHFMIGMRAIVVVK